MYLKVLNIQEIKNSRMDKKEAIQKKLIINDNYDVYLKVQALYKKAFDRYIEDLINIHEEVDNNLEKSKLDYGKIEEKQKNIYHRFSYLNSEYIFVRNFFYVERLDEKDLKRFLETDEITDEIMEIVKSTYKDIIKRISTKTDKTFKVCYGAVETPNFLFDNDSLVLFVNYGKNTIKLNGEEFIKNKIEKENYLDDLVKKVKELFEDKLECKVEIRYYKGLIS